MTKILRDAGLAEQAAVHGFRASFRTRALEETDTPWAVAEAALAHSLGDQVQQAYIRGDAYTKCGVFPLDPQHMLIGHLGPQIHAPWMQQSAVNKCQSC